MKKRGNVVKLCARAAGEEGRKSEERGPFFARAAAGGSREAVRTDVEKERGGWNVVPFCARAARGEGQRQGGALCICCHSRSGSQ